LEVTTTAVTALFFLFIVGMGLKAQRLKPVIGNNALIGMKGNTLTLIDPSGMVKVNGETWKAIAVSGKINEGEKIIVKEIRDLTLYVEPI
jgi:membrane-bound serine protease (ClpP class)